MRRSTDRILVSHAGNLPRPEYIDKLIDRGKAREGFEIFRCLFQLEAKRPAQREIAFDVGDQHAGLPAQG